MRLTMLREDAKSLQKKTTKRLGENDEAFYVKRRSVFYIENIHTPLYK